MSPRTLAQAVTDATRTLAEAGVPSPRVDAELLADHLLKVGLGRLRAMLLGTAPEPEGYSDLIAERASRVPLQHITGTSFFRHLELAVGPGVFLPRPETESVVQLVIDRLQRADAPMAPLVVDLGTGSGAIAGSIATEVPGSRVYAVELSPLAHAWAERNLAPLGVTLVQGDLRTAFPELEGRCDVVVSNPPYIPSGAVPNEPEVAEHDPQMALFGGGADGMELPAAAVLSAVRLLRQGGYFVLEHAEVQGARMAALLQESPYWGEVTSHRDLNGKERATSAVRQAPPAEMRE
ncbi:peptide chain release factor N(5)-glutamine methyltransferase [Paenarthrobacter sp. Z7-10]|uniref:peptide chain release factor N(5)-glutamine methyltransferase n=1 Tax=Paenarthrobacter sp. Z7-10 TaxID=2787635 RepID=UPI0022A9C1B4|nr:peptide chain release factor N(5)-glutamine methyltransferase [Paenarthrobacter sp. Z7-10]MCZ2402419.1 peptide chain release factor N(5)-glutamine methyltransferase [Paenarthrobacter sp. Z7-10]